MPPKKLEPNGNAGNTSSRPQNCPGCTMRPANNRTILANFLTPNNYNTPIISHKLFPWSYPIRGVPLWDTRKLLGVTHVRLADREGSKRRPTTLSLPPIVFSFFFFLSLPLFSFPPPTLPNLTLSSSPPLLPWLSHSQKSTMHTPLKPISSHSTWTRSFTNLTQRWI